MNIYVFDIDNTLCNTYPSLQVRREEKIKFLKFFFESRRILGLEFFPKMLKIVMRRLKRENSQVLFLTARNSFLWIPTYISLTRKTGLLMPHNLILVPNAKAKIGVLKRIITKYNEAKVYVIDDLSYNHEFGNVKYYSNVIHFCESNSRIIYVGKDKIDRINND